MRKKILIGVSLILATLIFSSIFFFVRANRPMSRAKKEAIEIAREHTDLERVDRFYWYTREESYFTLVGTDAKDKGIIVIIPQSGSKVTVLNQEDGLTEEEALQKVYEAENPNKVIKMNLGMHEGQPTWEVVAENAENSLDYYLVDFKTGEIVSSIKNI
ncbi:DUF5590 domain-containing protein [uncultured Vagococcus sp.]|uniref:cell wall elongation regulator TseB-like domain-containing protein n=1 Tax=uncultured Vagococcus sp. TaxID=189676 RepID=UPI0028D22587|nr:DUF5590 domain-containing protein [uncultured Vagococcus sp.]